MEEKRFNGSLIATLVFGGLFATLVIFNLFKGQDAYAPLAVLWVAIGAKACPKKGLLTK
ncbi:MAG: hypothetical protein Q4F05_04820 [bacterium]|nr:hypothetical protein [bacterium]